MPLVCELFRAHEMRSQLEVTEMLEPSFQKYLAAQKYTYAWKWGVESVLVTVGQLTYNPGYGYWVS